MSVCPATRTAAALLPCLSPCLTFRQSTLVSLAGIRHWLVLQGGCCCCHQNRQKVTCTWLCAKALFLRPSLHQLPAVHTSLGLPPTAPPALPAASTLGWACRLDGNVETCNYAALASQAFPGTACIAQECHGRYDFKQPVGE